MGDTLFTPWDAVVTFWMDACAYVVYAALRLPCRAGERCIGGEWFAGENAMGGIRLDDVLVWNEAMDD